MRGETLTKKRGGEEQNIMASGAGAAVGDEVMAADAAAIRKFLTRFNKDGLVDVAAAMGVELSATEKQLQKGKLLDCITSTFVRFTTQPAGCASIVADLALFTFPVCVHMPCLRLFNVAWLGVCARFLSHPRDRYFLHSPPPPPPLLHLRAWYRLTLQNTPLPLLAPFLRFVIFAFLGVQTWVTTDS